jgi:peptidoglycan/LPS O-acetylase OafA/YrhL
MMKAGLMHNQEAAMITGILNENLNSHFNFIPDFMDALLSVPQVFLSGVAKYNGVFWTMYFEFVGSYYIAIFLITLHFSNTRKRFLFWILATIILLIFTAPTTCFNFGLLAAFLYANKGDFIAKLRRNSAVKIAVIAAFIVVYGFDLGFAHNFHPYVTYILKPLAAVLIVMSLTFINSLNRFFSSKVSRFLGKISFPLYVIHMAIICSFTSSLMLRHPDFRDNLWTALAIYAASVLASLIAACCFYPVEKLSIWFSRKLHGFVVETRNYSSKQ